MTESRLRLSSNSADVSFEDIEERGSRGQLKFLVRGPQTTHGLYNPGLSHRWSTATTK